MNPLLDISDLPKFSMFHVEHIEPAVKQVINENKETINKLIQEINVPTWNNFVRILESLDDRLSKVWGPISHLDSVKNSDEWHTAYTACLPHLTEYNTFIGQNKALLNLYQKIEASCDYENYTTAQKQVVSNAIRDFKLSGIDLDDTKQVEFKQISQALSEKTSAFGNNVLKATQSWEKTINDISGLKGLPDNELSLLKSLAAQKNLEGWRITLDFPAYHAILTYAEDRGLREEVYKAFATRASEQSEYEEYDNGPLMEQILDLRVKKAELLGFEHYADLSIETKMADSVEDVVCFLEGLADKSKPQAIEELTTLEGFADKNLGIKDLKPWDINFVSEKLKIETLSLSQEKLRPYFPIEQVLKGLFQITTRLFNVTIEEVHEVDTWHPDVRFFKLLEHKQPIGYFYLDLFAREHKRGGAWMDSVISRWVTLEGHEQLPVAYLVCNFTPPSCKKPACLTHNEMTTLFHEFGHGIHHLFTKQTDLDVSGIAGVAWDAVELPSQFMENFCWEREGINLVSRHIETGETLPQDMLDALKKSRHFLSAMMMVRQIEFSLFDIKLHASTQEHTVEDILDLANAIRQKVAVVMPPNYHRFPNSFSHIFAGGYAAGYYSYKWAEVLSADAFEKFEETGVLNASTGLSFKEWILEKGGSESPMILFKGFRGREPKLDALLRHSGITG